MKKTIILLSTFLLLFGIVQGQTYRSGEARFCLLTSSTTAWDSITIDAKDTAGVVLLDTVLTGGGLRAEWAYTVGSWDGQITEEAKMWLTTGDSLRTADIYIVRPTPEIGDAMTLTTGERAAIEDTMAGHAATYKATGFAVAGDPMTLTTGERAAIEDTIAGHAATYKATGFTVPGDTMQLSVTALGKMADTLWLSPEALDLLLSIAGADSMLAYRPDSIIYWHNGSSAKRTFTISSGVATKWVKE